MKEKGGGTHTPERTAKGRIIPVQRGSIRASFLRSSSSCCSCCCCTACSSCSTLSCAFRFFSALASIICCFVLLGFFNIGTGCCCCCCCCSPSCCCCPSSCCSPSGCCCPSCCCSPSGCCCTSCCCCCCRCCSPCCCCSSCSPSFSLISLSICALVLRVRDFLPTASCCCCSRCRSSSDFGGAGGACVCAAGPQGARGSDPVRLTTGSRRDRDQG